MGRLHAYRLDPNATLDSAVELSLEERGAYYTLLDLILIRGGAVPDDERFIADWCRCSVRAWRHIRERLIDSERLYVRDGMLRNADADEEVAAAQRRHAAAQAAGRASGLSRRSGSSDIKDLAGTDVPEADAGAPLIATAREEAHAEIAAHLDSLDPYEMQDLTAGLLQAMGYATTRVAARGPDGGTDILACKDPLGASTPRLRVQVKHRGYRAAREDIAALRGIVKPDREIGLFVATGGFSRDARREADHGASQITLIDRDEFIALWIRHYDDLPDAARARMRLARVHFLDMEPIAERRISGEAA